MMMQSPQIIIVAITIADVTIDVTITIADVAIIMHS
jgi:hypothetical protein